MNTPAQAISEAKTAEAINATVNAAEAVESARRAQMQELVKESEERIATILGAAIKDAFGENKAQGRYIDVTRIPLICQNIDGIHNTLIKLDQKIDNNLVTKDQFSPVEKIVYGAVGLVLTSFLGAIIFLVLK